MIFERIVRPALIRPAVAGHLLPQAGEGILGAESTLSRAGEGGEQSEPGEGMLFRLNFIMR
jgi:hypothetical protein